MASQHNSGLPPGWEVRRSETYGLPYYHAPTSNTSCWDPPDGTDRNALVPFLAANFPYAAPLPKGDSSGSSGSNEGKIQVAPLSKGGSGGGSSGWGKDEFRVRHLLIKHEDSRTPSSHRQKGKITRTKDEAKEILKAHQKSILEGKDFAELAKAESDDSSYKFGGDLGHIGQSSLMKPFADAAFALQVGEMSDIVETLSGWHLILRIE